MANSLGVELEGKVVIIKKARAGGRTNRQFRVTGGFGASPHTMGTALIGEFVAGGGHARLSGYDVEHLVENMDDTGN